MPLRPLRCGRLTLLICGDGPRDVSYCSMKARINPRSNRGRILPWSVAGRVAGFVLCLAALTSVEAQVTGGAGGNGTGYGTGTGYPDAALLSRGVPAPAYYGGNYGVGGIRYVTRQTPTVYNQTVARRFFGGYLGSPPVNAGLRVNRAVRPVAGVILAGPR